LAAEPKRESGLAEISIGPLMARLLDRLELLRFVVSGVTAAFSNFLAVWLAHRILPYELSLVVGVTVGLVTSFLLSKWYAFGSSSLRDTRSELPRFLAVYSVGSGIYWASAIVVSSQLERHGMEAADAEALGVFFGAGAMTVATYLGHRLFTYRTYRRASGGIST
jgi:putative flippase GtrA